eukprot:scaffold9593_cov50-Skeletonema_dohrnii-CCMP3373.AAC.1
MRQIWDCYWIGSVANVEPTYSITIDHPSLNELLARMLVAYAAFCVGVVLFAFVLRHRRLLGAAFLVIEEITQRGRETVASWFLARHQTFANAFSFPARAKKTVVTLMLLLLFASRGPPLKQTNHVLHQHKKRKDHPLR